MFVEISAALALIIKMADLNKFPINFSICTINYCTQLCRLALTFVNDNHYTGEAKLER